MNSTADVYFDNSPVFNINPAAYANGTVRPIAWFADDHPLRSGWAWGQAYLRNGVTAFVATVGQGKLYSFGPRSPSAPKPTGHSNCYSINSM